MVKINTYFGHDLFVYFKFALCIVRGFWIQSVTLTRLELCFTWILKSVPLCVLGFLVLFLRFKKFFSRQQGNEFHDSILRDPCLVTLFFSYPQLSCLHFLFLCYHIYLFLVLPHPFLETLLSVSQFLFPYLYIDMDIK